jgi:hypothetical protein
LTVAGNFDEAPTMQKHAKIALAVCCLTAHMGLTSEHSSKPAVSAGPAVRAADFRSSVVYQSRQHPGYTSWVSFFPGEHGRWYIGCEEVSTPDLPLPRASKQWVYGMGLPRGYDKSKYLMELVLLQSNDNLKNWKVISRQPVRASGGSFAQARTRAGKFLRFVWACYSLDPAARPSEIYYQSADNARTWKKMPPFVSEHFVWYPHRLRTLHDGTLVLCTQQHGSLSALDSLPGQSRGRLRGPPRSG